MGAGHGRGRGGAVAGGCASAVRHPCAPCVHGPAPGGMLLCAPPHLHWISTYVLKPLPAARPMPPLEAQVVNSKGGAAGPNLMSMEELRDLFSYDAASLSSTYDSMCHKEGGSGGGGRGGEGGGGAGPDGQVRRR